MASKQGARCQREIGATFLATPERTISGAATRLSDMPAILVGLSDRAAVESKKCCPKKEFGKRMLPNIIAEINVKYKDYKIGSIV
jgi:hypothetical protein